MRQMRDGQGERGDEAEGETASYQAHGASLYTRLLARQRPE